MDAILKFFTDTLNTVAWMYILLPCVAIGGVWFTIRNRGTQFTKLGSAIKNALGGIFKRNKSGSGAVSPFQALTTALAATVGTGNIIGTSQAIAMGGVGAIFWLWVAALLGMIIKFSEVTLSVHYRQRNEKGDWVGGPMYYITGGMGKNWKWLAIVFAALAGLAAFGIGNLSQANSIAGSFNDALSAFVPSMADHRDTVSLILGIVLAVLTAIALFGGIKRIGKVTEAVVPFMSAFYIIFTLIVIGFNIKNIGNAFAMIFEQREQLYICSFF